MPVLWIMASTAPRRFMMGEDGRSFVASCKDVDKARKRLSGANKAQAVGEATEAKCDM